MFDSLTATRSNVFNGHRIFRVYLRYNPDYVSAHFGCYVQGAVFRELVVKITVEASGAYTEYICVEFGLFRVLDKLFTAIYRIAVFVFKRCFCNGALNVFTVNYIYLFTFIRSGFKASAASLYFYSKGGKCVA